MTEDERAGELRPEQDERDSRPQPAVCLPGRLASLSILGIALVVAVALQLLPPGFMGKIPLPFLLDLRHSTGNENSTTSPYVVFDNGWDGTDEIAVMRSWTLQIRGENSGRYEPVKEIGLPKGWGFTHGSGISSLGDLDGSGSQVLAYTRARGDTLQLEVIGRERPNEFPPFVGQEVRDHLHRDFWMHPVGALGDSLLVVTCGAGWDYAGPESRSIAAYSLTTGEEVWRFLTGSNAAQTDLVDTDGLPGEEILYCTSSPANGREAGRLVDHKCWAGVVDARGDSLWVRQIGGFFCNPSWAVPVRTAGGGLYVIAACRRNTPRKDSGPKTREVPDPAEILWSFDGATGVLMDSLHVRDTFDGLVALDSTHVAWSTRSGTVCIGQVDDTGAIEVIRTRRLDPPLVLRASLDLDGDGSLDLVGAMRKAPTEWSLVVLNQDLGLLAERLKSSPGSLCSVEWLRSKEGRDRLFVAREDRFDIFDVEVNPERAVVLYMIPAILIAGLYLLVGLTKTLRLTFSSPGERELSPLEEKEVFRKLLGTMAAVWHGGFFEGALRLQPLKKLVEYLGNLDPDDPRRAVRSHTQYLYLMYITAPKGSPFGSRDKVLLEDSAIDSTHQENNGTDSLRSGGGHTLGDQLGTDETDSDHSGVIGIGYGRGTSEQGTQSHESRNPFEDNASNLLDEVFAHAAKLRVFRNRAKELALCKRLLDQELDRLAGLPVPWDEQRSDLARPRIKELYDDLMSGGQRLIKEAMRSGACPVWMVVDRVGENLRADLEKAGVEFIPRRPPADGDHKVLCAPGDLDLVLENLLANSVRSLENQAERRVYVEGERVDGKDTYYSLRVIDTGCGIPRGSWEDIFRPGVSSNGGGRGLAICRRIVDDLIGSIRVVESRTNGGTTIEVQLPLFPPPRK